MKADLSEQERSDEAVELTGCPADKVVCGCDRDPTTRKCKMETLSDSHKWRKRCLDNAKHFRRGEVKERVQPAPEDLKSACEQADLSDCQTKCVQAQPCEDDGGQLN